MKAPDVRRAREEAVRIWEAKCISYAKIYREMESGRPALRRLDRGGGEVDSAGPESRPGEEKGVRSRAAADIDDPGPTAKPAFLDALLDPGIGARGEPGKFPIVGASIGLFPLPPLIRWKAGSWVGLPGRTARCGHDPPELESIFKMLT